MSLTKKQKKDLMIADICKSVNPKSREATFANRRVRRTEMKKGRTK